MNSSTDRVTICSTRQELYSAAANEIVSRADESIATTGRFILALSGGSTPRALFQLLASSAFRNRVDWLRVHFFWGDERWVAADHPDSNYRMAREALLMPLAIPEENVHRIATELETPDQAAANYESMIRNFFGVATGTVPRFDLILLGLGDDGHTASLFPHSPALEEQRDLVVANFVEKFKTYRITFTPLLINEAASVLFVISGSAKSDALKEVLKGEYRPKLFPSQLIQPTNGELRFLVDRDAAALL